jgi:hypothetical protein
MTDKRKLHNMFKPKKKQLANRVTLTHRFKPDPENPSVCALDFFPENIHAPYEKTQIQKVQRQEDEAQETDSAGA